MNIWILILMLFIGLSMWQYHLKIQNDYHSEELERRVLLMQNVALSILFLILMLAIGSTFSDVPIIHSPIWVWLMCLMLVYIGVSSIIYKASVLRVRGFDLPKGNFAVLMGSLAILIAVIIIISYLRGDLFFGIFN